VLLQVHYLSDVLAGWVVAASWIALCIAGLEALRLGERRRLQQPGVSLLP
jgi:membrane-associated phospholipid phosphatase